MILRFLILSTFFSCAIGQTIPCPEVPTGGCSVCGDGLCVTDKEKLFTFPNQPDRLCGDLELDAYNGLISSIQCSFLPAFVTDICGCGTESTPFTSPTPSPLAPAPSTPTESLSPIEGGNCPPIPQNGCSICGEGKCVNNKDAVFEYPNQPENSCGNLETEGRNGEISPVQCQFYPAFLTDICGCSNILVTDAPTTVPSDAPSLQPTISPTDIPSASPTTGLPSVSPTDVPSASPTKSPTKFPTRSPTQSPSATPTFTPGPSDRITSSPTTPAPTTPAPTTPAPTTPAPTTPAPTTSAPTDTPTAAPTTAAPTTAPPTDAPTSEPTTAAPTPILTCNGIPPEECPIFNTLQDANFFTILTGAMEAVGLDEPLSAQFSLWDRVFQSGFTLFAVADDQFDKLSLHMDCLLRDENLAALKVILNYHIVPEVITEFSDGDVYETLSGDSVTISVDDSGTFFVNDAEMRPPGEDFITSNGIIHLIDEIIIPPDEEIQGIVEGCRLDIPETLVDGAIFQSLIQGLEVTDLISPLSEPNAFFTIFAPADDTFAAIEGLFSCLLEESNLDILRDILLYHVLPGRIFLEELSDGQVFDTLNGDTVAISFINEEMMINDAVIKPTPSNVTASNGVLHLIEGLLIPPGADFSFCVPTAAPSAFPSTTNPSTTPSAPPTSLAPVTPGPTPSPTTASPTESPTTLAPSISSAPTVELSDAPTTSKAPTTTPTRTPTISSAPSVSSAPSISSSPSSEPVAVAAVLFGLEPDFLNWLILGLIILVVLLLLICLWYFCCRNRNGDDDDSVKSDISSFVDDSSSGEESGEENGYESPSPRDDDLTDIWKRNVWDDY